MDLAQRISDEIKQAMRERNQNRLGALRAIRNEIIKLGKTGKSEEISNQDIVQLIKSQIKQRQDSIAMFQKAGRSELVSIEQEQMKILQEFLPEQFSQEDLEKIIAETILNCNASSIKEMGIVMKNVKQTIAQSGKDADNRLLAELVKRQLSSI